MGIFNLKKERHSPSVKVLCHALQPLNPTEPSLTHVYSAWEHLTFGQNCKSVVKVCYVVLRLIFVCVKRFQVLHLHSDESCCERTYLQLHGWIVLGDIVSRCSFIDCVEDLVDNAWIASASN